MPSAQVCPFFDLVVLTASAGGLQAVGAILRLMPSAFPAAMALALHRQRDAPDMLTAIFGRETSLHVKQAEDGEGIVGGTFYIAPAGFNLLVTDSRKFALSTERRVKHVQPSGDRLFESAATAYRDRLIAVVLSGGAGDGSDGVRVVKQHGGMVIAQDPATAEHASMPTSAIQTGFVDRVLPVNGIGAALRDLVMTGQ